jgi:hypothetical protein
MFCARGPRVNENISILIHLITRVLGSPLQVDAACVGQWPQQQRVGFCRGKSCRGITGRLSRAFPVAASCFPCRCSVAAPPRPRLGRSLCASAPPPPVVFFAHPRPFLPRTFPVPFPSLRRASSSETVCFRCCSVFSRRFRPLRSLLAHPRPCRRCVAQPRPCRRPLF